MKLDVQLSLDRSNKKNPADKKFKKLFSKSQLDHTTDMG